MMSTASNDSSLESFDAPQSCRTRDVASKLFYEILRRFGDENDDEDFQAVTSNEEKDDIRAINRNHAHNDIVDSSLRLVEILLEREKFLEAENATLKEALLCEKKKVEEIPFAVHSSPSRNDEVSEDEKGEILCTPENLLEENMKNLKSQVDCMEEERQALLCKCATQESTISILQEDIELKDSLIKMLEELVQSMNHERRQDIEATMPTMGFRRDEQACPKLSVARSNPSHGYLDTTAPATLKENSLPFLPRLVERCEGCGKDSPSQQEESIATHQETT